ncbi:MAG: methyltransferase domain-containing protein [Alteromonadaceae bacterium]|nr:methyltransferase domain-containing protein [Alteromonadaceae bacterium]
MAEARSMTLSKNNTGIRQPMRLMSRLLGQDFVFNAFWKCPHELLERQFKRNISLNHLEVGVSNEFDFTKRLKANGRLNIAYLDPSADALKKARLATEHLKPRLFLGDLDDKWHFKHHKFDSVNLNFVLHGMEGDFEERVNALCMNARRCLSEKGKVFGSAILRDRIDTNALSEFVLNRYNKNGVVNSENDSYRKLERMLSYYFAGVKIEMVGYIVLFEGRMKESRKRGKPEMEPYNARNNVVNLTSRKDKRRANARSSAGAKLRPQIAG